MESRAGDPTAAGSRDRPLAWTALAALLVGAAVLRFTGLDWGLRHRPHADERYFVENAGWMLARGDLDHRFHEYPGLFFYVLAPVLAFFDPPEVGPQGYLAARAVVAAFGVASVGLVFLLGRTLAGSAVGLAAAALLAVNPIDVVTSHEVRPDVVLETFLLAGLLAMARSRGGARFDVVAGVAIGAATAVKFSGALLALCYLAARAIEPGRRVRGALIAGGVSVLSFALLSPASLHSFEELALGLAVQWSYHYGERPRAESFYGMLSTYLWRLREGFGVPALALAGVGLLGLSRDWRRWLPVVTLPVVVLLAFSTAEVQRQRFLVPVTGVISLVAAMSLAKIAKLRPGLAAALTLLVLARPFSQSVHYVRSLQRPGTRDVALDWIHAHMPYGSRILTAMPELGIDRKRFEVLVPGPLDERARLKALHWDLLVVPGPEPPAGFEDWKVQYVALPRSRHSGPPILLLAAGPDARPTYEEVAASGIRLRASENADQLAALTDGDLSTFWQSETPQRPGSWIQVDFTRPTRVARFELALGARRREFGQRLAVHVTEDGVSWRTVRAVRGRPSVRQQIRRLAPSQVRIIEARPILGLRIEQTGRRPKPWSVAELRIEKVADDAAAPSLALATADGNSGGRLDGRVP
jgi:hypothetical protein